MERTEKICELIEMNGANIDSSTNEQQRLTLLAASLAVDNGRIDGWQRDQLRRVHSLPTSFQTAQIRYAYFYGCVLDDRHRRRRSRDER